MNRLLKLAGALVVSSSAILHSSKPMLIYAYSQTSNKKSYDFIETFQYRANNPIEDRVTYGRLKNINGYIISVFDGHGGFHTAQLANKRIQQILDTKIADNLKLNLDEKALCEKSLQQAYDEIQNQFYTVFRSNIFLPEYQRVGACALTAIILKNNVYIANAGDCEGILMGNTFTVTNKRLNAGQPQQQQRLKKQFPNQSDIYKCKFSLSGTYCYVKGRLQPTRSLGDFYLKFPQFNFTSIKDFTGPYITHEPVLTNFKIDQNKYLVLATDGLWDQLTHKEVFQISKKHQSNGKLSEQLFNAAFEKVRKRTRRSKQQLEKIVDRRDLHDDISMVVANLDQLTKTL